MRTESHTTLSALEQRLEKLEKDAKGKSWCDFLQAVGPILIAAVAGWYTYNQNAHQNRLEAIQLQSNRETADADLRANMFSTLVTQFFKGDLKPQDRVLMLTLFENNFQDFFDAKPLFAMIYSSLNDDKDKAEFKDMALAMAEKQQLMLGAGRSPIRHLTLNVPKRVTFDKLHSLVIELMSIQKDDSIKVQVTPSDPTEWNFDETEFIVTYFDMPLTNNTELPDHHRFAVTLKAIGTDSAEVRVFELPSDMFVSKERPSFNEFIKGIESQPAAVP
jgi:hypothetical protein